MWISCCLLKEDGGFGRECVTKTCQDWKDGKGEKGYVASGPHGKNHVRRLTGWCTWKTFSALVKRSVVCSAEGSEEEDAWALCEHSHQRCRNCCRLLFPKTHRKRGKNQTDLFFAASTEDGVGQPTALVTQQVAVDRNLFFKTIRCSNAHPDCKSLLVRWWAVFQDVPVISTIQIKTPSWELWHFYNWGYWNQMSNACKSIYTCAKTVQ